MFRPLSDVFVLDLTRLLPGPFCTSVLGELGARVVKVEEPGAGDYARWIPPEVEGHGYAFAAVNRGKESVTVNLKHARGVEVVRRLATRADVVVEGFRPGVADRLGVGYEALSLENPRLVYAAISGFGATGPWRDEPGHNLTYESLAGILAVTGETERPALPAVPLADLSGALYAVVGILAALRERDASGSGRFLDLSLTDAALALNGMYLLRARAGDPPRRGSLELAGGMPGYSAYACADDRWLALACLEPKFWERFLDAVERPDLAPFQAANTPEAHRALQQLFRARDRDAWVADLAAAGVPVAPVLEPNEVLGHPHVESRTAGRVPSPGFPVTGRVSDMPLPTPGEHTNAVLGEAGYGEDEVARLRDEGALG